MWYYIPNLPFYFVQSLYKIVDWKEFYRILNQWHNITKVASSCLVIFYFVYIFCIISLNIGDISRWNISQNLWERVRSAKKKNSLIKPDILQLVQSQEYRLIIQYSIMIPFYKLSNSAVSVIISSIKKSVADRIISSLI